MEYENPFKYGSIRFDDYENQVVYESDNYIELENQVIDQKGVQIRFSRELSLNQDDTAKLKKNKPKNMQNSDFNPLRIVGWLDLSLFKQPGENCIEQRVYLNKMEENVEEEMTNYDISNCYVHMQVKADPPVF